MKNGISVTTDDWLRLGSGRLEIRFGKTRIALAIFLPNQYCQSVTLEVANEIGMHLRASRASPLTPLERHF
jgi:hypothetical protein